MIFCLALPVQITPLTGAPTDARKGQEKSKFLNKKLNDEFTVIPSKLEEGYDRNYILLQADAITWS